MKNYKKVQLSPKEIKNALTAANRYLKLIKRELACTNLVNIENVTYYTKCYQHQHEIHRNGYVIINIGHEE
jgi:hypothetical protein